MVFSSPIFLFLFLPVVLGLYLISCRRELRNFSLLVASLFFYAWGETWYVSVMLASIAANYLFGLWIDRVRERPSVKLALVSAVVFNLGLLGVFKYANFVVDNLNALSSTICIPRIELAPVHLPIGISFFTFQAMSYVIDVYRRDAEVQKNPVNVALYISLFPQLIAGPIVRYRDVARQLAGRVMSLGDFACGVRRFVIGLGKKVLVANVVGATADRIFGGLGTSPDTIPGIPLDQLTPGLAWLGALCYTVQIYFDFSGYSDMAIGLGRMFGFRFLENFDYPYVSRSVREFWKRWHISLSKWFRDFLYIPLGGSRCTPARTHRNLVAVFLLCGLWHGASWTFAVWGLYHGAFLVAERTRVGNWIERRWAPTRHLYALLVVIVGWVLFRSETLSQAGAFLAAMVGLARATGVEHHVAMYVNREVVLALAAGSLLSIPIAPALSRLRRNIVASCRGIMSPIIEGAISFGGVLGLVFLLLASASWLAAGTYNPFIYFRF
ncbi:MAG: MBOAT family O-acyltransferase [Planctomycetota bacterium]|jgi:alginate O-acetyltransferase complex protein AlgI